MKKTILIIIAITLCLGCAGTSKSQSTSGGSAKKSSKVDLSDICTPEFTASSLEKTLTSPIGSGDIDMFLLRAKMIKCNMYNANASLDVARNALSKIVATNEQLEQINQKNKASESAKGKDKEKIEIDLQANQDSIITQANKDNAFDNKTVDESKKPLIVALDFNISLAGIYELMAVKDAALMVVEGKSIVDNIKSNPAQAMKMGGKLKEITSFITGDIPMIAKLVPEHTKAFSQFITALRAIKKNNKIESNEQPKVGDTFKPMVAENF